MLIHPWGTAEVGWAGNVLPLETEPEDVLVTASGTVHCQHSLLVVCSIPLTSSVCCPMQPLKPGKVTGQGQGLARSEQGVGCGFQSASEVKTKMQEERTPSIQALL